MQRALIISRKMGIADMNDTLEIARSNGAGVTLTDAEGNRYKVDSWSLGTGDTWGRDAAGQLVTLPRTGLRKVRYNVLECEEFAARIKAMGFRVWLAANHDYGFISDDTGSRVLSFSYSDIPYSLSGNYGPASRTSGTGWRMNITPGDLQSVETVRRALYAHAPQWCGKGWKDYTTVAQHISTYGASSGYAEYGA